MLGTLLEASPPGARWPSFRDARALMIGGMRVRGWTWLLAMLWVAIGAGGAIYAVVTFSHSGFGEGFRLVLITQEAEWAVAGEGGSRGVLSVGEMAICAAWLVLGGVMTWILSGPLTRADSSSSDRDVATR